MAVTGRYFFPALTVDFDLCAGSIADEATAAGFEAIHRAFEV